jgi:hypothetical protein
MKIEVRVFIETLLAKFDSPYCLASTNQPYQDAIVITLSYGHCFSSIHVDPTGMLSVPGAAFRKSCW